MNEMQQQEVREEEKKIDGKAEKGKEEKEEDDEKAPPLMALNHVSRLCRNVKESIDFYTKVLGFVVTERPQGLDFEGAWLFNYGVGIHLVQSKEEDQRLPSDAQHLDPQDNHISFQCEDVEAMEKKLKEMNVRYMKRNLEAEDGTRMEQIFFNDPDGFMVEICNCENLKLVPAESLSKIKIPMDRHTPPVETNHTQ
ncbi:uncharacterized protein LOC114168176 [Vigna unguiculata]|uniref:Glyoxylase I family protein n=1 Tax=Vigna unguiculata TaxID=3917 RepID=A0A4D6LK70_VIGUN|nr:uncharacterized protein LOC114168176 [Vigna unguiculata]QCD88971.1 glyoxylase I family protein [Vigna unguiculata]